MTPAPVVITAAPDTLLVIAPPDVIDRLRVIAAALIDAHAGAHAGAAPGDCAAAGKCLRRYPPPPDDADTPAPAPDTPAPQPADDADDADTDGNDAGAGDAAGGSADLTNQGKLRCIALTNTGKRCMRARNSRTVILYIPYQLASAHANSNSGAGAGAGAGAPCE